jgi:hypothetical protein
LVSGRYTYIQAKIKRQTIAKRMKNPDQDIALATVRKVDVIIVAVARFINVLICIKEADEIM